MRTKEEILAECSNLYEEIIHFDPDTLMFTPNQALKSMTEYAREACEEQKHICQTEFDKDSVQDENGKWYVSCEDILKCNLPEGL